MGMEVSRHAELMELVEHVFALMVNYGRKRNDPEAYSPRKKRDFMPAYFAGDTPKKKPAAIGKQLEAFAEKLQAATKVN